MFTLKTSAQGLTLAETVQNMQRNIAEYGPIYVCFKTTNEFMKWPWSSKPVYTGGSGVRGGHAVIIIGWGYQDDLGVDYWRIRNSWADTWAEKGYGKFRRGVNLDTIESRGVAASMPTSDFRDWSPPSCAYTGWSIKYWRRGSKLTKMKVKFGYRCNKACTLKVFFSNRLTNRDEIYTNVNGRNMEATFSGPGEHKFELDIAQQQLCYGVQKGDMWMKATADDGKGNKGVSTTFATFDQVGGLTSGPCTR